MHFRCFSWRVTRSCGLILMYQQVITTPERQSTPEVSPFCQHCWFSPEQMIAWVLCSKTLSSSQSKTKPHLGGGSLPCTEPKASHLGWGSCFFLTATFAFYVMPYVRVELILSLASIRVQLLLAHKLELKLLSADSPALTCFMAAGCWQLFKCLCNKQLLGGVNIASTKLYTTSDLLRQTYPSWDNWNFAERIFALYSWKHSWYY